MYANEPYIQQKSGNQLEWSLTYSLFHWGPIAWSFYILLAAAFGYMLYITKNHKQKFSEACRPVLGTKTDGVLGKIIDLIAIFSLIAATATTFSMSMPLLSSAVNSLFHIGDLRILSLYLIVLVVGIYLVISILGMKAISRLSVIAFSVCSYCMFLYLVKKKHLVWYLVLNRLVISLYIFRKCFLLQRIIALHKNGQSIIGPIGWFGVLLHHFLLVVLVKAGQFVI